MKANEFVKKYGWDEARFYAKQFDDKWIGFDIDGVDIILNAFELKRLVESHELVKSYGGIDKAKDFISPYSNEQLNKKVYSPMLRIKQAIADVESCQ